MKIVSDNCKSSYYSSNDCYHLLLLYYLPSKVSSIRIGDIKANETSMFYAINNTDQRSKVTDMLKEDSTIPTFHDLRLTLHDIVSTEPHDSINSHYYDDEEKQMDISRGDLIAFEETDKSLPYIKKFFVDVVNDRQSKETSLKKQQCVSKTLPL
ncbi:unnamed protein product, partial [Rotaria sp. Silwood1]